jgi:hypothetical protein
MSIGELLEVIAVLATSATATSSKAENTLRGIASKPMYAK